MAAKIITVKETVKITGTDQAVVAGKLTNTTQLIVDEALKRSIEVEIISAENSLFSLTLNDKTIQCCDALSDLTSVIADVVCYDKSLTNILLKKANLRVPDQIKIVDDQSNLDFLEKNNRIVIKPTSRSSGKGVNMDINTVEDMESAIEVLKATDEDSIIMEEMIEGEDIRIVVIDHKFVAAVHRAPPQVTGNGKDTITELIKQVNKTKKNNNQIPFAYETKRCVKRQGYTMDSILPENITIHVRKNTNEHTGGTPSDVTDIISPKLREISVEVSHVLNIPVVGIDYLVPKIDGDEYVIIEANSSPGLFGHEPQPVTAKFIDFLFPETIN